jgi:hypothetical protein
VIRAHQPGSEPIDIPETIPNPVVVPKPTPTPTEPAPMEPVRIPEKASLARRLNGRHAVDSEGEVLGHPRQPRRDRKAALKLMRKLLKKQGVTPATSDRQARILQLCAARTWCCAAARHRSLEE